MTYEMTTQERNTFKKNFRQWMVTRAGSAVAKYINAVRAFSDDFRAAFDAALYKTLETYIDQDDRFKEAAAFDARMEARDEMKKFNLNDDQIERVFHAMRNAAFDFIAFDARR